MFYTNFVRIIPKYVMLVGVILNEFLKILSSSCFLLVFKYKNMIESCILTLHTETSINLFESMLINNYSC